MTLSFSESPAVQIKEIDLTGIVPAVTSTTGAIVGDFNWGPVNTPVLIGNEQELAAAFGTPLSGAAYSGDFLSAALFLKYSSSLFVVRADRPDILDSDGFVAVGGHASAEAGVFTAKYPGSLGDKIVVSVADSASFATWPYATNFTSAPDQANELHVAVIVDGVVVETYPYVSTVATAQNENGSTNYVVDIINAQSSWVTMSGLPANGDSSLTGGSDGDPVDTVPDYITALDAFANKEAIQIDFLIAPAGRQDIAATVHLVCTGIAEQRKDCVAVISPTAGDADHMVTYVNSTFNISSSYLIVDGNWIKVYNKYQDKYEFIPAASSTAGVMAATDAVSAPWFSPAGARRGQYLGVTELLINPNKTERDKLYKAGINPIVSFPGQGILLFGDKTHLSRPSAFDRINVRRLFLVIERAISKAGENVMFEFNDEFTRAEFVNIVEPFLREIQGRRGITDFRVVCDETNNTAEVIDRNEFVASCFIKPARSINYVTLNFVAVRSGVEFEEIVGTV